MPLTEAGIVYVSKNIQEFIKGTQLSTASVDLFNKQLKLLDANFSALTRFSKASSGMQEVTTNAKRLTDGLDKVNEITIQLAETQQKTNNQMKDDTESSVGAIADLTGHLLELKNVAKNGIGINLTGADGGMSGAKVIAEETAKAVNSSGGSGSLKNLTNITMIAKNSKDLAAANEKTNQVMQQQVVISGALNQNLSRQSIVYDTVKQDVNEYTQSIEKSKNSTNNSIGMFDALKTKVSGLSVPFDELKNKSKELQNNIKETADKTRKSAENFVKATKESEQFQKGVDVLKDTLKDTFSNSIPFGDVIVKLHGINERIMQFAGKTEVANETTKKWTNNLNKVADTISQVNPAAGVLVKLIGGGERGKSIDAAIDVGIEKFTQFKDFLVALPPQIKMAAAAVTVFVGALAVAEKMGERGAKLSAIANSYEKLRVEAGLSTEYLDEFTDAADNQLTKAQSLVLINKALAGSTGEFAKQMGDSLPTLLEFARVRSAATGEDVNYLFQSAIEGIKKGEPEILDNMGLVIRLDTEYENYAKTLGKTRDQLTEVEKQQAILARVNVAATEAINTLGSAVMSNADKMTARKNIASDILDDISMAFQDTFGLLLDFQLWMMNLFQGGFKPFTEMLDSILNSLAAIGRVFFEVLKPVVEFFFALFELIVEPFVTLGRVVEEIFSVLAVQLTSVGGLLTGIFVPFIAIMRGATQVIRMFGDILIGVINFFSYLGNIMAQATMAFARSLPIIGSLIKFLDSARERFSNLGTIVNQTGVILAVGFGRAVGSLVNTFARAAAQILNLVADLAEGIASFLIGQSPPPEGPLSQIDVGGAKTFEAWLDGFASVGTKPVEQVASEVNKTLGQVANMSIEQVENRLKQLDLAIRPFSEQLEIAKSRFEAISAPAEAALRAIDRQLDMAVEAMVKGDVAAANSVRALDAQRASIYKNLELQQQQVDFAQIQLAMAQSKQAEERALLNIQKARLDGTMKEEDAIKAMNDANKATGTEKEKTGSGESQPSSSGSGGSGQPNFNGQTGSNLGDMMLAGFADQVDMGLFDDIAEGQDRLSAAGADITEGLLGLPNRFGDAFSNMADSIAAPINDAKETVSQFVEDIVGYFTGEEFTNDINSFVSRFDFVNQIAPLLDASVDEVMGFAEDIANFFVSGDGVSFLEPILTLFDDISVKAIETFGPNSVIGIALNTFFGEDGLLRTAINMGIETFLLIKTSIDEFINKITGEEFSIQAVLNAMFGPEGLLFILLEHAKTLFQDFYSFVFGPEGVFAGLRTRLNQLITASIQSVLNAIAGSINALIDFVEGIVNGVLDVVSDIVGAIPESMRGPLADIPGSIEFRHVELSLPSIDGAAKGGMFTGGMLRVGERGEEIITSADKMAVFPNEFVRAIDSLSSILVSAMNVPSMSNMSGGNYSSNTNNVNQTFNINQPMQPSTLRQQYNNLTFGTR